MRGTALFVYGTLRDPACVRAVTGRVFATRPARLHGWRREEPPGGYPVVRSCPGASVAGLLLLDVDDASLARLDAYEDEGRLYVRRAVHVAAGDERVACEVYAALDG
jgi:gamma-glutamylcyclotransferase (GGCT)/AIG2-like uncharacterized protein YtfP